MAKPDVDTLLADPDFQAMDAQGQREILSEVSPEFGALAPERQTEALSEISQISVSPSPSTSSRGTMLPEEAAFTEQFISEAEAPGLERAGRAVQQLSGVLPALAGTLAGGAAGLGEELGAASIATTTQPRGLREAVSEALIAGALPGLAPFAGTISRAAPNLAQTALEVVPREAFNVLELGRQLGRFGTEEPERLAQLGVAGLTGGPVGAIVEALRSRTPSTEEASRAFERQLASQASQEVAAEPIAPEVFGEANIPLAQAIPVAAGAVPLVGAVPALVKAGTSALTSAARSLPSALARGSARVNPTATQSAMSGLRITAEEAQDILPSAIPHLSKAAGKAAPNTNEILQAAPKARQSLFNEATAGLTKARDEGLFVKGNSALDDITDAIQSDSRFMLDEPRAAEALVKKYEKYNKDLDPLEARKLLEDTNKKLMSHWDKSRQGQKLDLTDAEVRAERAFAANLSNQIDDLYKIGSRKNSSPYRDIGKIIELERSLKLEKEAAEQAFAQRVAPTRVRGGALPLGRFEAARAVGRGLTKRFRNTEVELLDKRMNEVFKGTSKDILNPDLPEEMIPGLSRPYAPRTAPPSLPESPISAAQIDPALALEQRAAEIFKKLPREFKNLDVARAMARSELAQDAPAVATPAAPAVVQPAVPATVPSQSLQQAISETVQPPTPRALPATTPRSPEPVPVKTYPPEVQSVLDARKAQYDADVQRIKTSQWDSDVKGRRLKAEGMRYAADKRQITGELTAKEFQAAQAREASNYVGKPISINLGGEIVPAEVIGNPFGRVKVRLADGTEMTVLPENIGSNLQLSIAKAAQTPLGSIYDPLPGDLVPFQQLDVTTQPLIDQITALLRAGRKDEALALAAKFKQ